MALNGITFRIGSEIELLVDKWSASIFSPRKWNNPTIRDRRSSTDQPLIGSILYVYIYILLFFLIFYAFACNFTISWIVKHRGNIFTENIERKKREREP